MQGGKGLQRRTISSLRVTFCVVGGGLQGRESTLAQGRRSRRWEEGQEPGSSGGLLFTRVFFGIDFITVLSTIQKHQQGPLQTS
jgi:hypothetical protein